MRDVHEHIEVAGEEITVHLRHYPAIGWSVISLDYMRERIDVHGLRADTREDALKEAIKVASNRVVNG